MAKFISKYPNHKIVMKSSYAQEVDGRRTIVGGESIQFKNGVYETDDKNVIKFLEDLKAFGRIILRVDKNLDEVKKKLMMTEKEKEEEAERIAKEKEREAKLLKEDEKKLKGAKKRSQDKKEKPKF